MKNSQDTIVFRPLSTAGGSGFVAIVPSLPCYTSDGNTSEEALANPYDAICCWIEAAAKLGRPIPQPRRAPV
ncbi:MAG: type II toxin-antitoxin system HicB family antitoxin [Sphingomonadales bacterium]|nr:type II toxin-antitoxin system HicB family antitoxin [Sphingomonadales bacterium]